MANINFFFHERNTEYRCEREWSDCMLTIFELLPSQTATACLHSLLSQDRRNHFSWAPSSVHFLVLQLKESAIGDVGRSKLCQLTVHVQWSTQSRQLTYFTPRITEYQSIRCDPRLHHALRQSCFAVMLALCTSVCYARQIPRFVFHVNQIFLFSISKPKATLSLFHSGGSSGLFSMFFALSGIRKDTLVMYMG